MVGRNLLEKMDSVNELKALSPKRSEVNLLNYEEVDNFIKLHKPDMVIHLAGRVGGIQANISEPIKYMIENMDMGKNIIMASRKNGIKKLINLGSSCMYPKNIKGKLKEEYLLTGAFEPTNEGYALAKITTLKLCEYVRQESSEYLYKTIIPCNLYGKWDKFSQDVSHMVPAVIDKLHRAKIANLEVVDIWGDGKAKREFLYAGDLADCILKAIEKFDQLPYVTNIGQGYDYTINEYYETIAKVIGYEGGFYYDLSRPVGMQTKLLDTTKQKKWGWNSSTSLEVGVRKTYEFYLKELVSD